MDEEKSSEIKRRLSDAEAEIIKLKEIVYDDHAPLLGIHAETLEEHRKRLDSHASQLTVLAQIRIDLNRNTDALTASLMKQDRVLEKLEVFLSRASRADERIKGGT